VSIFGNGGFNDALTGSGNVRGRHPSSSEGGSPASHYLVRGVALPTRALSIITRPFSDLRYRQKGRGKKQHWRIVVAVERGEYAD